MTDNVETMFSARTRPWHGLGNVVAGNLTAKEAIKAAGLDWRVDLRPVLVSLPENRRLTIPGRKAVVRDTDNAVLGLVSNIYHTFQNHEAFDFLDTLVDSGEAMYETAGALRKGKTVFITAKLPKGILVGGEDPHDLYLLIRASHDGTSAISVNVTPIRVECENTLTLALRSAKHKWTVRHTSTIEGKIQEARDSLKLSFKYADEFAAVGAKLMGIKLTDDKFHDIVSNLFAADNDKVTATIERIMDLYETSPTNGYRGTAWGGLNAVSEFYEHYRRDFRSLEARLGAITGWQEKFRNRATSQLLELAK